MLNIFGTVFVLAHCDQGQVSLRFNRLYERYTRAFVPR